MARITDGEQLPHVSIGFVPVDDAAAMLGVDLHVDRPMRRAAVLDSSIPDPPENGVELFLTHTEAVVVSWKSFGPLVEVEGQPVIDVHG